MKFSVSFFVFLGSTLVSSQLFALENAFSANARIGYFYADDSSKGVSKQARTRLRATLKTRISPKLSTDFGIAGRFYDDGKNDLGTDYLSETPYASDSIPAGQVTIHKASINYSFNKATQIKFGRFQSKIELAGVAKKSLDRNDSPNTDINWTDGLRIQQAITDSYRFTTIFQRNPANGSNLTRKPLSFENDKSRLSVFMAIENVKPSLPIIQQTFDITYLPQALCVDGIDATSKRCNNDNRDNYIAFVGRIALKWPIGHSKRSFGFGADVGTAPNVQAGSNGSSVANNAWMLSFNLYDFLPKQSVGLIIASADAGWLISPDVSNDYRLVELRYAYKISKKQKLEWRYRQRDKITGTARVRKDSYLRFTQKF